MRAARTWALVVAFACASVSMGCDDEVDPLAVCNTGICVQDAEALAECILDVADCIEGAIDPDVLLRCIDEEVASNCNPPR
jgi:hypothetical protein